MDGSGQRMILVTLMLTLVASANVGAAEPSSAAPSNEQLVRAMHVASTWGHPDLFGEFAGMRHYDKGDYKKALTFFKYGARFADKPSQLAIGMIYANGLGVEKDLVAGCAWFTLAAERKYPRFVATEHKYCDGLTSAQSGKVAATLDKLRAEFGDKVAKRRMAIALSTARTETTGSRVGYDFGIVGSAQGADMGNKTGSQCNSTITVDGIPWPTKGCVGGTFWSAARWDPKAYFASRDAYRRGTVTVEPLQNVKPTK